MTLRTLERISYYRFQIRSRLQSKSDLEKRILGKFETLWRKYLVVMVLSSVPQTPLWYPEKTILLKFLSNTFY